MKVLNSLIKILNEYWKKVLPFLTGILVLFGILDYFAKWGVMNFLKGIFWNIWLFITSHLQLSINFLFLCWLILLTFSLHKYYKRLSEAKGDFVDDFRYGLGKWDQSSGNVNTNNHELSVTNCGTGILTKNGQNWQNYIFEFETKIIKKNSSWIVRAKDFNNYVMFQFDKLKIKLHYRIQGDWDDKIKGKPIKSTVVINNNEWFKVKIKVNGNRAIIYIKDTEVYDEIIFDRHPDNKGIAYISFPVGRVGFRESGSEHSYFRNVKVTTIP